MVRFLVHRPIGTCVVALTLMALGIITARLLPVSLLPDIPVPELTVQASYPSADARQIQQLITQPLRNQLLQLNHLDDLEATSQDGRVVIKVRLNYGTNVDLAYLEANEKIDALMSQFPRDLERPLVIKAGAGDIPVFQLNVFPADKDSSDFLLVSEFCENVLKRRLEQLSDIALVDLTGQANGEIVVRPDRLKMQSAGLTPADLIQAIQRRTEVPANVTLREGPYEYSIRLGSELRSRDDIRNTYLTIGRDASRRLIKLGNLATVTLEEKSQSGLHTYNGHRAVGMAIIKRSDAQILKLRKELYDQVDRFRTDYPALKFEISQDQTELLNLSIDNLIGSLLTGALLTLVMIFFFMSDRKALFIISLVIPISLTVTMLGFYLLGLSINIVSLAGLVLGIGEIIDCAIIIIENIEDHREEGQANGTHSVTQACSEGAEEVIRPLFTSVLTNSAVFLPLLFLSGIAGALFYDQALAVSLSLGISLLCSYTLVPVLYHLIYKKQTTFQNRKTATLRQATRLYETIFHWAFRRPTWVVIILLLLLATAGWVGSNIDKRGMPQLSRTELEAFVDWNEPLSPLENRKRINQVLSHLPRTPLNSNSYIGTQQFLLNSRLHQAPSEALLVMKFNDTDEYESTRRLLKKSFSRNYPSATVTFRPALNIFEQLFRTDEAELKVRLYNSKSQDAPARGEIDKVFAELKKAGFNTTSLPERQRILLTFDQERLALYGVDSGNLLDVLRTVFNENILGSLRDDQKQLPILLGSRMATNLDSTLQHTMVTNLKGQSLPIQSLVSYRKTTDYASLLLGKEGAYIALTPQAPANLTISEQQQKISQVLSRIPSVTFDFTGSYFRDQKYILELAGVIAIAIAMLFFILAAQFESLLQPFIVLLTIVFGTTGALTGLYLAGNSLNIMSAIGLVVLIGLLDNDSILKIDTMNRSRDHLSLMESIKEGGRKRLQSQLMTYLTTVLGLLPILWTVGLGAELQRPLALAVISGMTLGVLISWTFIPLTYWWLYTRKR